MSYKKYLELIAISALSVFSPIKATLVTVAVLVLCDLVLGIWAAKKRGEIITSAGMRQTVSKIIVYETCLGVSFIAEKYLMSDMVPITKLVATLIGSVELRSLFENCNVILGENLFDMVVAKLGSKNQK